MTSKFSSFYSRYNRKHHALGFLTMVNKVMSIAIAAGDLDTNDV